MKKQLTLFTAFLSFVFNSYAGHSVGSEITYKLIDSLQYEVTLTKFRMCSGSSMTGSHPLQVSCSSGSSIVSSTLTRVSIEELKLHCSSTASECSPQNTRIVGSEGVERHVFKDTIDFTSSTFSGLASCSGTIRFAISECCRPGYVNTGGANTQTYNYAEVNLALGNSSVDLTNDPHLFQCCSQPVYYNMGARDTIDRDSISYAWSCPMTSATASVSYTGNYSCAQPFDVYYPGSLSWPFNNPNSSPPIGIHLDSETGNLTYTPTSCTEISPWVIEAIEWRRDSSGTAVIVGRTRRDLVTLSLSCPSNNTPVINGPYFYNVCEGDQLCFNITTNDVGVTTPPPSSVTIMDTLLLSWNEGIPGASFSILDTTARLKTGQFCWTPPAGSSSSLPYTFTVTADDNNCNRLRKSNRAFRVKVNKRAATTVSFTNLNCSWYTVNSEVDSATFEGSLGYEWYVLDSLSNIVSDNSIAYFESSGNIISVQGSDSLKIQRPGTYIVKHTISNPPLNCPSTYYDTLIVGALTTTTIDFSKDTIVCTGSAITLNTTTSSASTAPQYQWYANDVLLTNDTLTSLTIQDFQSDTAIEYRIQITDTNGCTNSDAVIIRPNVPYQDTLTSMFEACQGDTVHLSLDTTLTNVNWSNGSSDFDQSVTQSGLLNVTYTDIYGCSFNDSTNITIHPLPQPVLKDSTYCGSSASISPGTFDTYVWSTLETTASITANSSGTYSVLVIDGNSCQNTDSATLTFLNKVEVELGVDTTHCGPLTLSTNEVGTYDWNTGSKNSSIEVTQSGNYSLTVTDISGCFSTDDINVTIIADPSQTWDDTLKFCSNTLVEVSSDSFDSYLWNNGATTRSIQAANGPYSITYFNDNGCSNTDTIYVKISAIPSFSLGGDTSLCGNSFTLSSSGGKGYLWNTGATSSSIDVNLSGIYSLTRTDFNDCSYTDSIDVTLLNNPNIPVLSKTGLVISSNQSGAHRWYKDGVIIGGQSQNTLAITEIGNYTATTVDANDCESDLSNAIAKTLGVDKINKKGITVYPNPTVGKVTIKTTNLDNIKSVKLYDSNGRLIAFNQITNGHKTGLEWTPISGVLWIEIVTDTAVYRSAVLSVR